MKLPPFARGLVRGLQEAWYGNGGLQEAWDTLEYNTYTATEVLDPAWI